MVESQVRIKKFIEMMKDKLIKMYSIAKKGGGIDND
jgi:hypothetical protein